MAERSVIGVRCGRGAPSIMSDHLLEESRALLEDYLQRCLRRDCQPPPTPVGQTLWRVTGEILTKNRDFYESCELLSGDPRSTLEQVAAQLPEDGGLNWGRIIGLIAFTGVLLQRDKAGTAPEELAGVLSRFLVVEHGDWFREHGAWVIHPIITSLHGGAYNLIAEFVLGGV